jgi:hypothetical protein
MQTYLRFAVLYNKYGQVKGPELSTIFERKDLYGTRAVFARGGFEFWEEEGVDGLGGDTPSLCEGAPTLHRRCLGARFTSGSPRMGTIKLEEERYKYFHLLPVATAFAQE